MRDFIKKIGTGPHGARDLSRSESLASAELLLSGGSTPAQTGALLLGLRLKGETEAELAGFLGALKNALPPVPVGLLPDLDIGDPYDGRGRTTSLVVPAALHAARFGLHTVLHGLPAVPVKQGPGVLEGWKAHGLEPTSFRMAPETLEKFRTVCLSQSDFLPGLARLLPLRRELGLRTIFNIVEKAVNPLGARTQLIGIFHEPVMKKLQSAILDPGPPGSGNVSRALPERIVFIQGVEGGVDLHSHRPTTLYITTPGQGLYLSPVVIPAAPPGFAMPVPDGSGNALPTLANILETPGHPMRVPLERQTAFLLFVSGFHKSFSDAMQAVSTYDSTPLPRPPAQTGKGEPAHA